MSEQEIEKLKIELENIKKQAEEYLNGWKRAKADYLNREREIEKEKVEWIKFANLELILNLLPILDSFEACLGANVENNNEWSKGVLQIKQQFESFLKAQGVEKIETIGEKFNPELHEVVEKRGEGCEIIEEIQVGYILHGCAIRPAKVVVQ
jgi:molecular chaperone GrpE